MFCMLGKSGNMFCKLGKSGHNMKNGLTEGKDGCINGTWETCNNQREMMVAWTRVVAWKWQEWNRFLRY